MRIRLTITVAVLAALLCAASALSQNKEKASQGKGGAKVTLSDNKFEPKTVTIKSGSEVTWENKEGTHTVTADDGSWTSPTLSAGQTYSHKFEKPGKYPYYCKFHGGKGGQNMSGVVNVTP
jgi:plastocyanin